MGGLYLPACLARQQRFPARPARGLQLPACPAAVRPGGRPGVAALMAAGPPVAYVYSPEYAALCDSLCKVPKRVGCRRVGRRGAGLGGRG